MTNNQLAKQLAVSERLFYRRIKSITGITPNQYIREIRLNEAKRLLEKEKAITVKEVAAKVGYTKTVYFSDLFMTKFGLYPKDILDQKTGKGENF